MSLKSLKSLGTYDEINRGAHRKAVSIIGVPSIIRHLGFWNAGLPSGASTAPGHEKRVDNYRNYVGGLVRVLEEYAGTDVHLGREPLVQSDVEIDTGTVSLVRF